MDGLLDFFAKNEAELPQARFDDGHDGFEASEVSSNGTTVDVKTYQVSNASVELWLSINAETDINTAHEGPTALR